MQKLDFNHTFLARLALILFIASELCYYLLIAQTGVVEYFSSDIMAIAPLPIGGMVGSFLTYYLKISNKNKIAIFLTLQLSMSFFYPNFSIYTLFILGISVGALAPLLINELKKAKAIDLGLALSISYVVGTLFFNYEASLRGTLAIGLTLIPLICLFFLPKKKLFSTIKVEYSLFIMVLWVFLDSALFETLSRDINISIWRDGYTLEIVLFHIIGVFTALKYQLNRNHKELLIIVLFAFSYLLYFLQEAFILSLIYPFVISYYNVAILQTILKKGLKAIAVYMVFIGWVASGAGLFVALNGLTLFVPIVLLIGVLNIFNSQYTKKEELNYA